MEIKNYINATQEAAQAFFSRQIEGDIVMLNLLKFREVADYSHAPELAPDNQLSGKEAYQLYIQHVTPLLDQAGSEILFTGKANKFLIGPEYEVWDAVILVRYVSVERFVGFFRSEAYQAIAGHRGAALEDSRLLPVIEGDMF